MKKVTSTPLVELWNEDGIVPAAREKYLGKNGVVEILDKSPVEFVVVSLGNPPRWIPYEKCYEFWRKEGSINCVDDPDRFYLEDYPNEYAYVASEWSGEIQTPIILLEEHH